ncbi:MAG: acetyltransferase [Syntrophales bacterium]|jgi:sugar O-acyltransferase (sialic acid O-acetyltransferase NeuD family)
MKKDQKVPIMKTADISSGPLVVFGHTPLASLAWYCLTHDSAYEVAAFTVNRSYLQGKATHEGLPVVPFEELEQKFPPASFGILIPLGYHAINGLRRSRFEQARAMGYPAATYISSRAIVWPDLNLGRNCLVYEGTVIQPFSRIGDNVIIRSHVHISHHCTIGSHVFIAAGTVLGGGVTIGEQAFVGLGAIIRDGVTIAARSFIGAGAVVIADTEPDAVYVGNPARKTGRTSLEVTA